MKLLQQEKCCPYYHLHGLRHLSLFRLKRRHFHTERVLN